MSNPHSRPFYSIIISVYSDKHQTSIFDRTGDITVDWVDFTREKSIDTLPSSSKVKMRDSSRKKHAGNRTIPGYSATNSFGSSGRADRNAESSPAGTSPDDLSLQPLLGHFPGPNPLDTTSASGVSSVGRGIVHLFRHAPPPTLIASLDAHPVGESSSSAGKGERWAGDKAEGEDGSLIAILAVPAWMRPADFLEFIGGWTTCLEGVRMIRYALVISC